MSVRPPPIDSDDRAFAEAEDDSFSAASFLSCAFSRAERRCCMVDASDLCSSRAWMIARVCWATSEAAFVRCEF